MHILLYFIRHGETDLNVKGCLQGQIDTELNEIGIRLATLTGEGLRDVRFDRVITSPLKRACRTAELIMEQNRVSHADIELDDRIMEISFGEWDGRCCLAGQNEVPMASVWSFYHDPRKYKAPPGGETIRQVIDRTNGFLQELIHDEANDGKMILISTHGCAMRALLHQVYEDKEDFWHGMLPKNCAVNVASFTDGKLSLLEDDALYYDERLSHNWYSV